MATISIVISVYNEEAKLPGCLSSVTWADEILVVDNESTDKTALIAKQFGARVVSQPNKLMLNINKNYGFQKATSDWILNLDADERVTEALQKEILSVIQRSHTQADGYKIPRKNIIFGKWIEHGIWWPDYQIRLFKKNKGAFPCVHVHEYISVDGKVEPLQEPMIHENYQTVSQFLHKLDAIYTENEVENLLKKGHTIHWSDALTFPAANFLSTYYAKQGYKDGLHGLVLGLLQAVYGLVTFAKLWEKDHFKPQTISSDELSNEIGKIRRDLTYWQLTQDIETSKGSMKSLYSKAKRKFISIDKKK